MMTDQAKILRNMVREKGPVYNPSMIVAIASGKGGVGKSNLTVNLGLALQQLGFRAAVFDGDLGLANLDILVGAVPRYTLQHVVRGEKGISEITIETRKGLKLIPGASGVEELASLSREETLNLVKALGELEREIDYFLIDTGAGIHDTTINLLLAADKILVLITPEPTSIIDAYGLIKVLSRRQQLPLKISVVVNQVSEEAEGEEVYHRLAVALDSFLKLKIEYLGSICYDRKVGKSVNSQTPFVVKYPYTRASQDVEKIARRLSGLNQEQGKGLKAYLFKMVSLFQRGQD